MRILIIEDDAETRGFVERGLSEAGFQVTTSEDGRDGLFQATGGEFDVIVVDRMLPEIDGLALVKALRATGDKSPILMLTALGGISDRVDGLQSGADDYLVKPFAFAELAARIQALSRRPALQEEPHKLIAGEIELDFYRRTVVRRGRQIPLQPREFALLAELMQNPGRIITRTMLLERVWDLNFDPKTNIVETHISRLRAKLNDGFDKDPIKTMRGAGYSIGD